MDGRQEQRSRMVGPRAVRGGKRCRRKEEVVVVVVVVDANKKRKKKDDMKRLQTPCTMHHAPCPQTKQKQPIGSGAGRTFSFRPAAAPTRDKGVPGNTRPVRCTWVVSNRLGRSAGTGWHTRQPQRTRARCGALATHWPGATLVLFRRVGGAGQSSLTLTHFQHMSILFRSGTAPTRPRAATSGSTDFHLGGQCWQSRQARTC